MDLYVGAQCRLVRNLTAIKKSNDQPKVETLPPDTVLVVAAIIQGSMFVQVTSGTDLYDVAVEDLIEAAEPEN